MKIEVIKRDGRIKDFDETRIKNAISKAYEEVHKNIDINKINLIEDNIIKDIGNKTLELNEYKIHIETIQDIVIKHLKQIDKTVGEAYEKYRNKRTLERDRRSSTYKKIDQVLNCKDIINSNANVDEYSFGGRKFESANIVLKQYSLNNIINPKITQAHRENRLYIHDLDSYATGMHNCSFPDVKRLIEEGFCTRNGDVRGAKSISTAMQQLAVIFQIQSQEQFGGTGSCHIDYDLEVPVELSFKKHFSDGLHYFNNINIDYKDLKKEINLENINELKKQYPKIMDYALNELEKEGQQSAQALYHNLNTLESRPGSQVPFTSINFGRRTSVAGKLVSKWLMYASLDGIGKFHKTSIFPISIFQYKKGINDREGTPNYDLKQLAIKSMSKRIYPNWVNCDWIQNKENLEDPDTYMATMGCVDGKEVITYKIDNKLFVESFERMWDRLSKIFEIKEQNIKGNYYMDLKNITIYDTQKGFVDIKRIIKNKDKGDWVKIKFSNGRCLTATQDHPLPIIDKGRTFVKDIKIGDSITINQNQYSEEINKEDVDKAWLLGFILCDGCYDNHIFSSIDFDTENDIEERYKKVFKKVFNQEVKTIERHRGKKGNYKDLITIGSTKLLQETLINIFEGKQKIRRHIPTEVFSYDREAKLSFLAGMIDADGYINSTSHGGSTVQLGSINKELSLQTLALAQSLGLPSKIYLNHYNSRNKSKIRYRIEFSATLELIKYLACNKKINCFKREANITKTNESKIISIEFLGNRNEYSYDVTTESDYFEVSGIYSHNCRTLVGYDRHGMGYSKVGRGNVTPVTINLVKIGIKHGICLKQRKEADLKGFWNELDEMLELAAVALVDRFNYICKQSPKSAPFMYKNKTMLGGEYNSKTCIYDVMKHGSQAIGYAGVAEMCQALFGKDHSDDEKICDFAVSVIKHIYNFANKCSEKYDLNFGVYASPIESTCGTIVTGNREVKGLRDEFGIIPNVTDRDWITNSHHVPVWKKIDIFKKLNIESRFTKYPTSGCITYVELDSSIIHNPKAIEQIIDYAFNLDIPYLAFNFPIDTCLEDGYQGEFNDKCPICGSTNIEQLRRVTGYLTTDFHHFNHAKQEEVKNRFKHSTMTQFKEIK